MKIRKGFISNSSTTSFIIRRYKKRYVVSALKKLINFYNDFLNKDYKFDDIFNVYHVDYKFRKKFEDNWNYKLPAKTQTIIESKYDNSIPTKLYDLIEEKFYCSRTFLG